MGRLNLSDSDVLKRLIQGRALIALEDHYNGKKKVVLKEPQTEDSFLELHNIPDDSIVIDLDGAFSNDNFFQGSQGECKRADFIVISEIKKKILFIEMKRAKAQLNDIVKQLKGSLCAFEYTQSIVKQFFNKDNFLLDYELRFISVTQTGSKKGKTKIEKTAGRHDSPERPLKLSWANQIQFNKIAA